MATNVSIPKGEETITVELTLKEAIALTGVRFNQQPDLMPRAKRKILETIEHKLVDESEHRFH